MHAVLLDSIVNGCYLKLRETIVVFFPGAELSASASQNVLKDLKSKRVATMGLSKNQDEWDGSHGNLFELKEIFRRKVTVFKKKNHEKEMMKIMWLFSSSPL